MSSKNTSKTYKDRAKAAASKAAALGEDIDLTTYVSSGEEHKYQTDPSQLPARAKEQRSPSYNSWTFRILLAYCTRHLPIIVDSGSTAANIN